MKKRAVLVLLGIAVVLQARSEYVPHHNLFESHTFDDDANAWVSSYAYDHSGKRVATDSELQYVLNLMYYSYVRSFETLCAQQAALYMLKGSWEGWQNIAKRRLNPSKPQPYSVCSADQIELAQDFWRQYEVHQRTSDTYDHAVQCVVYTDVVNTPLVMQGVKDMRTEARKVMLDALADIKQYFGKLFDYAFRPIFKNDTETKRGIADFVMSYIPQLAVNTFIHADALHNDVSDDAWNMLYTVQDVGIQTWSAIEKARKAFYKAHYTALYYAMVRLELQSSCFTACFNESGVIAGTVQTVLLPHPDTLQ